MLREHESTKLYHAEKTSEAIKARNKANLLANIFNKAIKLFEFSYRTGKAKGIKVGRKDGKVKYVVPNPPLRFPLPEILEDEKLSLSDVDMEDEATPKDDSNPDVVTPTEEPANLSIKLWRIDVIVSDPTIDRALSDSNEVQFLLMFLLALSLFVSRSFSSLKQLFDE